MGSKRRNTAFKLVLKNKFNAFFVARFTVALPRSVASRFAESRWFWWCWTTGGCGWIFVKHATVSNGQWTSKTGEGIPEQWFRSLLIFCINKIIIAIVDLGVLKFDSPEVYLSYQNWIICTETVTRAFWNNVKDFFFSVDLMEAFGVIETNKCLGLTGKEGNMLVSRCLFLVRFYILSCQYKNLKPSIVEYRQLYHWIRNLIETEIFEGRWEKIFRKGIYSSELSFFPPCFLKEIQYEQIPKDKRKYFFYVISCPATLLSIC